MKNTYDKKTKKWAWYDTLLVALEVVAPVISILCSVLIQGTTPDGQPILTIDERLAIIVSGFTIQLVLFSIHNKLSTVPILETVEKNCNSLLNIDNTVQIADEIKNINNTKDEHRINYFQRRFNEFELTLRQVAHESTSGQLGVGVYYKELETMVNQLLNDENPSAGSIWAMTGFSELEWSDNGWEKDWTRILCELSSKGIITERVCLIDKEITKFLKCQEKEVFDGILVSGDSLSSGVGRFKSFVDYLKNNNNEQTKSYFLATSNARYNDLIKEKGFFGIVLSKGEKYLTKGEALTVSDGLTGEYVFDVNMIDNIYSMHKKVCIPDNDLLKNVNMIASIQCKDFLNKSGVSGIE